MSGNLVNYFALANTYGLKAYLEGKYGMEFRGTKTLCPFHSDRNPTLSVNERKSPHYFQCFSCGAAGDIVKFTEKRESLPAVEAAKSVLAWHGVDVRPDLSDEEKKIQEAEQKKRIALIATETKEKQAIEDKERKKVITKMTKLSPVLAQNLYDAHANENTDIIAEVESRFPNIYENTEVRDVYLGYDYDHESICIINREMDSGKTFNIKYYREKDKEGEWKSGKWISRYLAPTRAFGLDFLKEDGPVFICEGEKDVINLLLLGCNALTLGGVSTSWDKHAHGTDTPFYDVLRDRECIIWFDNDKAGYINAAAQHKVISEVASSCRVVLFNKLGNYDSKYDVSDYLAKHKFASESQLHHAIAYSSFVITNNIIDEIIELQECERNEIERLLALKTPEVIRGFYDCSENILKLVKDVKGERQEEVKLMNHLSKQMKDSTVKDALQKTINSLFPEKSEFLHKEVSTLEKIIHFKKSLFTEYAQTHIRDIVMELMRSVKSAGYEFATYRGILYFWTGNYYYAVQSWEIESFVMQKFFYASKVDFKKHTVKTRNEVVDNIYGHATPMELFIEDKVRVINLLNGVLKVRDSGKFVFRNHHKKQDCAMNMLEFNYDENAECKKWDKFLNRILPDEGDRNTLEEFIGYCLLPSHRFEAFMVLYGSSGANGKSVILEIIRSFFSRENASSLELHNFEGHELASLSNKIINIGSELSSGADLKKPLATLKALVSSYDTVNVNPKHDKPFTLYPDDKPKCIFATNKMFKSGADDGGVLRRALVISFDVEIKDNEKIRDLVERMEDEKSGILNRALTGLQRLLKQGHFTISDKRAEYMEEFKKNINPVRAYIIDNLRETVGICVPKKVVYAHYKEWATEMGHNVYSDSMFWQKFKEQFQIQEKRPNAGKFESHYLPSRTTFLDGWHILGDVIPQITLDHTELNVEIEKYTSLGFSRVFYE